MNDVTIYHNPRCSKSRETLALLQGRGLSPRVVEYLATPPDEATLRQLLGQLGMRPADLVRQKEAVFDELGLGDKLDDDEALLRAMARHPILIERPIVVSGGRARVGRPPESVLAILPPPPP
jgi:arsenate reductase